MLQCLGMHLLPAVVPMYVKTCNHHPDANLTLLQAAVAIAMSCNVLQPAPCHHFLPAQQRPRSQRPNVCPWARKAISYLTLQRHSAA